ncbi:MAG: hypothetical protein OXE05_03195 [Chloroflexi bacterium]|nr:hypothetical protein [Chloroflexota bacterium]
MKTIDGVTHEPDESCSLGLTLGVGFQGVLLSLPPTVLTMLLFARASGLGDGYVTWSVLAAVAVSGIATALQAARFGSIGGGNILMAGAAPSYLAIALLALDQAGPATLATLLVVSSLFQFGLAASLPRLRRIITPVVSGTVIMLIAASVLPLTVNRLEQVPEGAPALAAPAVAAITLLAVAVLGLRATGALRLWTPLIGVVVGCVASALFGIYDPTSFLEAPWIGVPELWLPGFDISPGVEFWALLPMFLIVSISGAIKAVGSSVVLQQVSWREPRVTDYRRVQGTVNANAIGSVLSGFLGVLPTGTYAATSVSLTNFTGVAARTVGYTIGIMLIVLALLPKPMALLLTVPNAVTSAYMLMLMGLLFVEGLRTVMQDSLDQRKVLIVALSLAVGIGLQSENVITQVVDGAWGLVLGNGLIVGAITALLLTTFIELVAPRRRRLEIALDISALPRLDEFLTQIAAKLGWNDASANRLRLVGEEALSSLLGDEHEEGARRLIVLARPGTGRVELEFMAVLEEENIEDALAYMSEQSGAPEAGEISLRLLRHFASGVRHRKYQGIDIVTVEVLR